MQNGVSDRGRGIVKEEGMVAHMIAPDLQAMFRMPMVFGPAPGPRNVPAEHQKQRYVNERTVLTIDARSDPERLKTLLPAHCHLHGAAILRVSVSWLRNLGWLAGRGYNIVTVQIPDVAFAARDGDIVGDFNAVVWENLCDPIITGREEIAFPKIWAEIPEARKISGRLHASALWLGHQFFELTAESFVDAPASAANSRPVLVHKYIPRTGEWGTADADYMTASSPDPLQPIAQIQSFRTGRGSFAFRPVRWEDMPTQYPIVNALAELPLEEFHNVSLVSLSQGEVSTTGGGNFSGQHIVDARWDA